MSIRNLQGVWLISIFKVLKALARPTCATTSQSQFSIPIDLSAAAIARASGIVPVPVPFFLALPAAPVPAVVAPVAGFILPDVQFMRPVSRGVIVLSGSDDEDIVMPKSGSYHRQHELLPLRPPS
ncbi:hypothetical protein DSL72_000030 [Monilinia vaccinii-corymbosi]|uniref:Uncharacterized protein n=1 Tax=Monilinia vaccinii-corymbosi TaxID=61207 RepID=A0A8A3P528_9HELO|nr:hypothetical protein DSL72_000030 [Monilinia vaccinii-corymbosi]